ncbi:putative sporulation protein YtxC [Desmospora activa DSM 45169]|uniref:Putative sporulation protein YtxC n=2 Tax=Desmospora TaxID=500614 RepID=A0A2T4Z899_9BACL|nr:putative sporulation protein YtxC [Desmospora activa DSM 45169]
MVAYHISVPGHSGSNYATRMRELLVQTLHHLEEGGTRLHLEEAGQGDRTVFHLFYQRPGKQKEGNVRRSLSNAIADYFMMMDEPALIRHIICKDFRYHHPAETEAIEAYAQHILAEDVEVESGQYDRREKVSRHVSRYLQRHRTLAVDGFFRFRMKRYRHLLVKLVEHAIDEYLLDQEYQEFINLLRYFVSVQKPKIPLVQVFHHGKRRFHLLDGEGNPLSLKETDGVVQELMDQSLSQEDMIVSSLLTVAPDRILLHTVNTEETIIRTLIQIFENRIQVCQGCPICRISRMEKLDSIE